MADAASPSVALKFSTEGARELHRFVGTRALVWGAATVAIGLATFAIDLIFAVMLQRFLVAIELVPAASTLQWFGPIRGPLTEGALFLALGAVRVAATFANAVTNGLSYVAFEAKQRRDIARWALASGRAPLGRVTTLFNDSVVGSAATVSNVFFIAGRGVLITGIVAALAFYSWQVTAALLALVALAAPLQRFIDRRLSGVSRAIQHGLATAVDRLTAGVKNAVFLHIHGLVGEEARRVAALTEGYASNSRFYYALAATRVAVPQFLALVVVVGIAAKGSAVLGDDKSRIVAYLYLALRLFQSLAEAARIFANLRLNWPRLGVLLHWWRGEFTPIPEDDDVRTDVAAFARPVGWRCRDVSFEWEPGVEILRRLTLDIPPGSLTVIAGPSGVGKTSLLLLLMGLVRPHAGSLTVDTGDGDSPLEGARGPLMASAAFVGPDPFVVPGTIRDFLALGLARAPCEVDVARALAQAHCEFVERLPRGLEHPITEQGGGLSAGQKQRLSLARALLRRPKVLLLDEATANLDAASESTIVATLGELKGDMTIVAVTHREALRAIADQVITLTPGARPAVMEGASA